MERDGRWVEINDPDEVALSIRGALVTTGGLRSRPTPAR